MTLEMVREAVVDAAGRMDEAAAGAEGTSVGEHVGTVGGALPGSTSGPAATTLGTTWTSEFEAWVRDARDHAETMRTSAANIEEADTVSAAAHGAGGRNIPQAV
ncbi:hypothetical protein RDV89_10420 [Nocardioides zeae]|uniref:Excreted virulence factor EspC (Type VII ESX diderm) n=1 Tax=Nocardioides imazamoxiresistens TaxID=3231893 RepID=A0ABU3PX78_9ACTN|nr:hypothetical protein [Nocardioides zeae]MDT9593481.1 hypothetical protein [Nocardioides zeae]